MLEQVLTSPLVPPDGKAYSNRGSAARSSHSTSGTTAFVPAANTPKNNWMTIVAKKYPTAEAYQKDIPNLLMKLGFAPDRAQYVADQHHG